MSEKRNLFNGRFEKIPNEIRFDQSYKIDTNDCWVWQRNISKSGYGGFSTSYPLPGKTVKTCRAHRYSFFRFNGPLINGLVINHLCRNRACVNPKHLEQVTHATNIKKGMSGQKEKNKPYCKWGHKRVFGNFWLSKGKYKQCRECNNRRSNEAHKRKRNNLST